jgi:uncharacterized protein with von Willebrand factor type A (vWA) domain
MTQKRMNILIIIDESGSMQHTKQATIQSVNDFIAKQIELKTKADLEVITFNARPKVIYSLAKLKRFDGLNDLNYAPSGGTAIYDSFGSAITRHKDSGRDTILVLLTDGEENSSCDFNKDQVGSLIKTVQDELKWEVVFLGTNIRDIGTYTSRMNIRSSNVMSYADTSTGKGQAMNFAANLVTTMAVTRGYTTMTMDEQ